MKFTCQVEIELPREKVVALWSNPDNLQHWQDGFIKFEHLSGRKNTAGSKGIMHYNFKGQPMELEETIIEYNLPDVMEGLYVHEHMSNRMRNIFTEVNADKTRWTAEIEYIQFNSFKMKVFAFFGKGLFRKQTQKWLHQFKAFAEHK